MTFENLAKGIKANQFELFVCSDGFHGDIYFITSVPFISESIAFLVPPGEPYTAFEKMILPFDDNVWLAILVTLGFSLSVIQIINFTSEKVQNFVYGRKIQTPTLNFIDIFLNGGQSKVPQRNFARFLLMLFIIWSLIIRTCYQSQYFKFLQADMRKPRINSYEELVAKNFSVFTSLKYQYSEGYPHKKHSELKS